MQKNSYLDNVVLNLKRQYSKDELVSHLTKKLSEKDFRIGELISENDELKYLLKKEDRKIGNIKIMKSQKVMRLNSKIKLLKSQLEDVKKHRDLLISKSII